MNKQAIQILASNDNPNGVKILELLDWPGRVFIVPRANLKEIKNRNDINNPALYFLFGKSEESTFEKVYIGESESFYSRLENHDTNKDFWSKAIVFTGNNIDRADVKYLENKSTLLAREANRFNVLNKNQPQENKLSEFKKTSTDSFFEKVQYIMAFLDFPIFQIPQSNTDKNVYSLKVENIVARGKMLDNGGFIVLGGSEARVKETDSFGGLALGARREFLNNGTLIQSDNQSYIFTKDVIFNSPSASAATIAGRSINGWTSWKDSSGKTLDENLRK